MNVLLVEDDETVAKTVTKLLERAGFQVTTASTATDALAAVRQTAFHALVVDLILPRSEGTTFYDELSASFPEMAARVLFVTGWASDPKSRNLLEHTGRRVLGKPLQPEQLVAAVREIANTKPDPFRG